MQSNRVLVGAWAVAWALAAQADVTTARYVARTTAVHPPVSPLETEVIAHEPTVPYEVIGDVEVRGITGPASDFIEQMQAIELMNPSGLALYEKTQDAEGSEMVLQALRTEAARNGAALVIVIQHTAVRGSGDAVLHFVAARAARRLERRAAAR